jgi:hypothetical protein
VIRHSYEEAWMHNFQQGLKGASQGEVIFTKAK